MTKLNSDWAKDAGFEYRTDGEIHCLSRTDPHRDAVTIWYFEPMKIVDTDDTKFFKIRLFCPATKAFEIGYVDGAAFEDPNRLWFALLATSSFQNVADKEPTLQLLTYSFAKLVGERSATVNNNQEPSNVENSNEN